MSPSFFYIIETEQKTENPENFPTKTWKNSFAKHQQQMCDKSAKVEFQDMSVNTKAGENDNKTDYYYFINYYFHT